MSADHKGKATQAEREDAAQTALVEAGVLLASELALPALLKRLVEVAVRISGARYGALGVLGASGQISQFITVGVSDEARSAIGPIPRGRGILGALIHDPRPLRLDKLQADPRSVGFPPNHPLMTSFLGAPVRARGQVFGNLYLTEKRGGVPFDERDERAVTTLATQAGVAIANAQTYRELEQREAWLGALHRVTAALLAREPAPALLQTIVASARDLAQADIGAIALRAGEGSSDLKVVAAVGAGAPRLLESPARSSGTVSHEVLRSGQAQTTRASDTDLSQSLVAGAKVPVASLMVVPLKVGETVSGTISLTLSHPQAEFARSTMALLQSFADQAALALAYTHAQARSMELAVLEERTRIARDIHDEPVQALIHLARRLEVMAAAPGRAASAAGLEETRSLAVAVVDGLRQLSEGLRSEVLEREGLVPALQDLGRRFARRTGLRVRVSRRGAPVPVDLALGRDLLRLAQEALSNVERHAQADSVRISLTYRSGEIRLRVSDNGVGFVSSGPSAAPAGLGTVGMQERVTRHGGQLQLTSAPGRGTTVEAVVPGLLAS
ncbi:MAG: sensor histidine kinase [Candidatus Dormibacteria bacterium]